jgi:hypothetical protein
MKSNLSNDVSGNYSPSRVFLSGLVAGVVFVLIGTFLACFLGAWESMLSSQLLWVMSPLGAAVAGGKSASQKGGARGRVIAVALFALVIAVSVGGFSDYLVLWVRVLPQIDPGQATSSASLLWGRHLIVSSITITLGALLGMLFGKGVGAS